MLRVISVVTGCAIACAIALAGPAHADVCHPFQSTPRYTGAVPTPSASLGQPLGNGQLRDVTVAESDRYLQTVAAVSPRVVSGVFGRSVEGRPLRYAIVGKPANVTDLGLAAIRTAARTLQTPELPRSVTSRVAASAPGIFWVGANVHGDEEGGTDAALRTLYELADRDDCVVRRILDESIVVVIPTQNPDGREADTRQSRYGFDLNRDWFARTQPETDGKVELMRQFPPVLAIDDHEMPIPTFLFPPVADPVYHEIPDRALGWINDLYGDALGREFDRQGIPYFTSQILDLLYMGYGDTVPVTGFGSGALTLEKHNGDSTATRVQEHFVAQWTTLFTAATAKDRILTDWNEIWREALAQGKAGQLEPNAVVHPENPVQFPVPDERVRHYFIRADEPHRANEVRALVRDLQRMDVEVRRLTAPLRVPDFKPYGRARRAAVLPSGTYWVSMAQRQKHWIQAMLNEEPYVPFPYFYDISAWSLPLLSNLNGSGRSGAVLAPASVPVSELSAPDTRVATTKRIGLWQFSSATAGVESSGWLRWKLEREWRLPYDELSTAEIAAGQLRGIDVLAVPDGIVDGAVLDAIGPGAAAALTSWLRDGGRIVAWGGGVRLAGLLGLTSATVAEPTAAPIPGSLVRAKVAAGTPLTEGVGDAVWVMNVADDLLTPGAPSHAVVTYPEQESEDFFISGYHSATNAEDIDGTAAVVDEPRGRGRFVGFASDPNFRGYADGTARLLLNALVRGNPESSAEQVPFEQARPARVASPGAAAFHLTVDRRDARDARRVLRRHGARVRASTVRGQTTFRIANPAGVAADQHPWVRLLPNELREAGVRVDALVAL